MLNSTLSELSEALKAKKISSVELTRQYLGRIGRLNGELNAFITVDEPRALADAKAADARLQQGQRLRPDAVTEPVAEAGRELYQSVAPAVRDGLYLVPKVIE